MSDLRWVTANGIRVAYRVLGPEGAPAVLLLHARGEGGTDWDAIARVLAVYWRVYVPDLRGHGDSDWPGEYSFELMHDDMVSFVSALDLDRVIVIGHSMGAVVAYLLAEREPQLVEALVLEEPPAPMRPAAPLEAPERPEGPLDFDWALVPATTAQRNDPDPRWWSELAGIKAPTLVIAGGPESHLPQEDIAAMAERMPSARLVTIPAGHLVHATSPTEYLSQVTDFLQAGHY